MKDTILSDLSFLKRDHKLPRHPPSLSLLLSWRNQLLVLRTFKDCFFGEKSIMGRRMGFLGPWLGGKGQFYPSLDLPMPSISTALSVPP